MAQERGVLAPFTLSPTHGAMSTPTPQWALGSHLVGFHLGGTQAGPWMAPRRLGARGRARPAAHTATIHLLPCRRWEHGFKLRLYVVHGHASGPGV